MSVAEKLKTIAENEQKVFDAGKKAENDAFWDMFQNGGNRNNYAYAFYSWGFEYIEPKYKVVPTNVNGAAQMFYQAQNLKKIEARHFDLSQKPQGSNNNTGYHYFCSGCGSLEEIEDIGLQALPNTSGNGHENSFSYCYSLHTIAKIRCDEKDTFVNTFRSCIVLENITFEGVIGQNIDFSYSPKLSVASMKNIISCLNNYSGTGDEFRYTLYLPETCWTRLEADSKAHDGNTWREYVNSLGWNT